MKKLIYSILTILLLVNLVGCSKEVKNENNLKNIDFILDWTPNTNHTGLYVAKEKGYFAEAGINLDIKLPPEDSSAELVINNKAPFAISFQDALASKFAKNAPITAVATIIENNTSGIITPKKLNITSPKELENKKYGTWNDPIELAMIKNIVETQGGNFNSIELIPNTDSNAITALENNLFDSAWIYYGWDGILAKNMNLDYNFFYLKDYSDELNYYSPVIIANNEYLKNNKEEAKKVLQAIKKGYQYAIENPEESAEILIKNVPELASQREFIIESQKYLATQYATNKDKWGEIDSTRWNKFYNWINENNITEDKIGENVGFTNEYLK